MNPVDFVDGIGHGDCLNPLGLPVLEPESDPVRSRDVAAVLIARDPSLRRDPVKLNALLYLCQGWSLAWSGRPLFSDEILAGRDGPFVTGVFRKRIRMRGRTPGVR